MAGLTVSVDKADGEGSVSDAAVLLAATAWGRAWRLALGGSLGRLLDILLHMPLHLTLLGEFRSPTSHAVFGELRNPTSHTLFVELRCPTPHAVWRIPTSNRDRDRDHELQSLGRLG